MDHTTLSDDGRIAAARTTLAERMAALEDRVTGTVTDAADHVKQMTGDIRQSVFHAGESVRGLVDNAGEGVREALDIKAQVQGHPWPTMLLAVGAGVALRMLTKGGPKFVQPTTVAAPAIPVAPVATEPAVPNPLSEFFDMIKGELRTVGQSLVKEASQQLHSKVSTLLHPEPGAAAPMRGSLNGAYQRA